SLFGAGALLRTVDADEFLYDPDAAARSRTDLRAFTILGATLFAGIVAIGLLWFRKRQPGAAKPATAAPVPATPSPKPRLEAPTPEPVKAAPELPVPADLNGVLSGLERSVTTQLARGVDYCS